MGGVYLKDLKSLYRWLHETMRLAGKTLDPNEWILYGTRRCTPRQTYYDCGLYAALFGLCVAKRYFLKIVTKERIAAAQCLLLLRLIDLELENAEPLKHGPVGRKYRDRVLHPFYNGIEFLPFDLPKQATDLVSPNKSDDSVVNCNTPPTLPGCQVKDKVVDLMTPPKALPLDLTTPNKKLPSLAITTPEKDAEADTPGTNDGGQNSAPSANKASGIGKEGGGSSSSNPAAGSPSADGGGAGGDGDAGGNVNGDCEGDNGSGNCADKKGSKVKKEDA